MCAFHVQKMGSEQRMRLITRQIRCSNLFFLGVYWEAFALGDVVVDDANNTAGQQDHLPQALCWVERELASYMERRCAVGFVQVGD